MMNQYINQLSAEDDKIQESRKPLLTSIATKIRKHLEENATLDMVVICTHNSRRSQLAQAWIEVAARHFNIRGVKAYSAGTEATAFNHRMVAAMKEKGFTIGTVRKGKNPRYEFHFLDDTIDKYFSKRYNHTSIPNKGYMAIMVCSDAEQNCPIVSGMKYRIGLSYIDPKKADDTPNESKVYKAKVDEIGREILYMMQQVKTTS